MYLPATSIRFTSPYRKLITKVVHNFKMFLGLIKLSNQYFCLTDFLDERNNYWSDIFEDVSQIHRNCLKINLVIMEMHILLYMLVVVSAMARTVFSNDFQVPDFIFPKTS